MPARQFIVTLENSAPQPHIERTQVVEVETAAELYDELLERFQLPTSGIRIIFYTSPEGVPRYPLSVNDLMAGTASALWIRVGIP
jgi:hypothetical protein